ncbi:Transcription factor MBP1 [Bienertia sinuspersici]
MTSLVVQSLLTHDEYSDHLFDKTSPEQQMIMMIHLLLEKDNDVACWRNASGLTPLHKATSLNPAYNLDVIKLMIKCCPQSIEVCDNFGKNILHHLINRIVFHHKGSHFFEHTRLHGLINQQDEQGNTPLVMAVISKDVIMVDLLKSVGGNLFIKNNQGHNAATLIQQTEIYKV